MTTLHNVLRIVLVNPPSEFEGMTDLEPRLEEKTGSFSGTRDGGNVVFETRYTYVPAMRGHGLKREKDGRFFVYIGWYGTQAGVRTRFRRLKIHLDASPNIIEDSEITVAGKAPDGSPACATAQVLAARNIDDYLPEEY